MLTNNRFCGVGPCMNFNEPENQGPLDRLGNERDDEVIIPCSEADDLLMQKEYEMLRAFVEANRGKFK